LRGFYTFAATKPHHSVRQAHHASNHPEQREGQGADGAWPLSIPSLALGILGEDTETKPKYNFKQTPSSDRRN